MAAQSSAEERSKEPVAGLILAAGKGTRMKSDTPKVLHTILGLPLLEYPIRQLEGLGATRVGVVIGAGADRVRSTFEQREVAGRPIEWAIQEPQNGTGDAVRIGLEALSGADGTGVDGPVFILNGDLPLLTSASLGEMLALHRERRAALTILTLELDDPAGYGRIVRDDQGRVADVVEDADADEATRAISEVNGGVYLVDAPAVTRALAEWIARGEGNVQDEIYFPPVIRVLGEAGETVVPYVLPRGREGELQQVNDRVELGRATTLRRDQVIEAHQRAGVTIVDPRSTFIEEDVEIGRDAVIHPFTMITRGATVGPRCQVGPFAHLRTGADLREASEVGNFTEVKNTVLGEGSKAKHLSYLGDGRIGRGVNVGAGTILANYDGTRKSPTTVGDGAFIGSGTILVAPVTIGENAQTGAGSVVVRGRDVAPGETVVGVPARPLAKRSEDGGPRKEG